MAVVSEAGELAALFRWLSQAESERDELADSARSEVMHEAADVAIYLFLLADRLEFDLVQAIQAKIDLNEVRYPAETSKGTATEYTDLREDR